MKTLHFVKETDYFQCDNGGNSVHKCLSKNKEDNCSWRMMLNSKTMFTSTLGEICLDSGADFDAADISTVILDSNLCDWEQHLAW